LTGQLATMNGKGFQMGTTAPLFNEWANNCTSNAEALDIGAAFGINTFSLVNFRKDVKVIALDTESSHLNYIENVAVKEGCSDRVRILKSSLPSLEGIQSQSISSILCAEVMHFLNGEELEKSFHRFYDVLVPGGKLCLSCVSTKMSTPLYQKIADDIAKNPNNPYPTFYSGQEAKGMFDTLMGGFLEESRGKAIPQTFIPSSFHWISVAQVARLAENANFLIDFIKQTEHPGYPQVWKSSHHNLQLVATKPS